MEHKTISLSDQVFEHIETDILTGRYQRGEVLTELKLSSQLGVSRTPIREALRRLEQEHLIEETGKGAVVVGITERDLDDIFLIRRKLDGLVCKTVAEIRNEEQLNELRETIELQEFYLQKGNPERIKLMDNKFHELIYKFSGRNTVAEILMLLHRKIQKHRRASIQSKSRADASVTEHRKIYEAIARKDAEAALTLSVEHIENAYNHIKEHTNGTDDSTKNN